MDMASPYLLVLTTIFSNPSAKLPSFLSGHLLSLELAAQSLAPLPA
jgi:hypothetical protein